MSSSATKRALAPQLATLERRIGRPRARRVETAGFLDTMLYQAGCARRTLEECRPRPEGTLGRSAHVSRSDVSHASLAPAGIAALVDAMDACAARSDGWGRVGLDALGGAIGRPAPDATAFVHRRARFIAQYATYARPRAPAEVVDAGVRWLDALHAALRLHASGFAYQNYIDPRLSDWARAYDGANLPRLQAIKARVDPDDVFCFAQSIPMA